MLRLRSLAAVSLLLLPVVWSCGGDEAPDAGTTSDGSPPSADAAPPGEDAAVEDTGPIEPQDGAVDVIAPGITITRPTHEATVRITPLTLEGNTDDESATIEVNGVAVTKNGNSFTAQVPLTEGRNSVTATARDPLGNTATASIAVILDTRAPAIAFTDPAAGALVNRRRLTVRGTTDDGDAVIVVNGVTATVAGGRFTALQVPVGEGAATLTATATDHAGNRGTATRSVTVDSIPPEIVIDTPTDLMLTRADRVTLSGTVNDPAATVQVNLTDVTVTNGRFSVPDLRLNEGRNVIVASATDVARNVGVATVQVVKDTTAPRIRIESPADGAIVTSREIEVAGLVNDLIVGTTINRDDVVVTVNGLPASVDNRSFVFPSLLLQRGPNTIVAEARDRAGNARSHTIHVTVQDQAGARIVLVSGNGQSAPVGRRLPDPIVVTLRDARDDPVPGRAVDFEVIRGDGTLSAQPQVGTKVSVLTDDRGLARATFDLGSRTGSGNHRVRATAAGFVGAVETCFSATTTTAWQITTIGGDRQRGAAGEDLPDPLIAMITDPAGNPVEGIEVEWITTTGSFGGSQSVVRRTSMDGLSSVIMTLGPEVGVNVQGAVARLVSSQARSTSFVATALESRDPARTTIAGVVLDNMDLPIPGVTTWIVGTPYTARTDAQGQFSIANAPVGPIHLFIDGATATRPGRWPSVPYSFTTIPGQVNTVGRPIHLPQLSPNSTAVVGGAQNVTLSLDGVPGTEMTVFANSVTCPGGARTCQLTWSQVNNERVPMEAPNGSSFMLAWTIQPAGVRFDPPARVCIPNMGGTPGQQVEVYSFDHEIFDWVAVGIATVSADGRQLCSDPGFGVAKSGWGGCSPPPPPPNCTNSCDDGKDCTDDSRDDSTCMCKNMKKMPEGPMCGANTMSTASFPVHDGQGHIGRVSPFAATLYHSGMEKIEVSVCVDGNNYVARVDSSEAPADVDYNWGGKTDCDGITATEANYCNLVAGLSTSSNGSFCISRTCVRDHEYAHVQEWRDIWNNEMANGEPMIEMLSVPADENVCKVMDAESQLRPRINAAKNMIIRNAQRAWNTGGEGVNGYAAEERCYAPKRMAICAMARANRWRRCGGCP